MKAIWTLILSTWLILTLDCLVSSAQESESDTENGYIFTCPRSMSTGATNQLVLFRTGDLTAGEITVKILYQETYNGNESLAVEKTYEIQEGVEYSYLDLYLENFDTYVYNGKIVLSGNFGGNEIGGRDNIYFNPSKDYLVVLQTDKPLYKEGQVVRFRVLKVNKQLKPSPNDKITVYVEDPKGVRFFQKNNISLEKGLVQEEFPLANEPELGTWRIVASYKDDSTAETFEVAEYKLPTFEVTIKIPSYVLVNAEEINITVCAKYTYGKPVEGNVVMNVLLETYQWSDDKLPVIEYADKINGCFNYTINVSRIETGDYYRYRRILVNVTVVESGTGIERNATEYISRQFTPLILSFNDEIRQYFKPGLPYNGKLSVKNPDNTPAAQEDIQICFTASKERQIFGWFATRKVKVCKNFTSNAEGIIEYILPPQNIDTVGINVEAKSLKYARDPKADNSQSSLSQPQTSMSLTPYFSPSGSFIQLQPIQETLFCGASRKLKVLFTSRTDDDFVFRYQVISQSKVKYTGVVEKSFKVEEDVSSQFNDENKLVNDDETVLVPSTQPSTPNPEDDECPAAKETRYVPPVGEVYLEIPVAHTLSPSFRVVVYYIRKDRETIADSQKLNVEKCFKNQVKLQFGDDEKQPGTRTSIRITSSPNSLCGIKVVDKSVSLINSNEQITQEKIFKLLESLDSGMFYGVNHCNEEVPQPGLYRAASPGIILPPKPWSSSSYEDAIAAFENSGLLVISDLRLVTRPCKDKGGVGGAGGFSGYEAGAGAVAMASTARRPAAPAPQNSPPALSNEKMEDTATKSVSEVRSNFPETWLFDLEMTGPEGEYLTKETLPDTITEWIGNAFCINEEDGLGISNKTSIRAFQAFFISVNVPYSVVRGEKAWITITIFNYVKTPLPISITLDEPEGFEVSSEPINGDICVPPEKSKVLKVQLVGTKMGQQNITVKAESATSSAVCGDSSESSVLAKDAIRESIIVEPEGWPVEKQQSTLFCPKDEEDETFKQTYDLIVPDDAVEDSERAYIDMTGNVFGKSLENLDNLVSLPTGCGEQNMIKFIPNVVVLDLLIAIKQLEEKTKARIIKNLIKGAQNQMQYKHSDGSYSAFGSRDNEGSMFLTAFVLAAFSDASKYISFDDGVLVQAQNYIISKQKENGCFPNTGKVIVSGIQGGIDDKNVEGRLTAYVLIALQKNNYKNQSVIDSALSCMKENEDDTFYTNMLYAYVEALAGNTDSAKQRIAEAREKSITVDGTEFFHDINATRSEDIETASYAILAILKTGGSAADVLPIVRYLTKNMNPNGGFYSTQDTCVALTALSQFGILTYEDPVEITVKISGGLDKTVTISEDVKLTVKREKVEDLSTATEVEATGTGCAVIQSVLRYNTNIPPGKRNFNLEATGKCLDDSCKRASVSITVGYIPEGKKTNMALIEVKILSGMAAEQDSLDMLKNDPKSGVMRVDIQENSVILYLYELTNDLKKFTFTLEEITEVADRKPGLVKVYDYYNPDITGSTIYTLEK